VTPIISTILLVGITIAAGVSLWALQIKTPGLPTAVSYEVDGNQTVPAWGDGSDCTTTGGVQSCLLLPAFDIVFTEQSPGTLDLSKIQLVFFCNQTVYLQGTLRQVEWVPGTAGSPGAGAPQLGRCGSYVPPSAAFNRFAYFQQLSPGAGTLKDGDLLVVYAHTFTTFHDDDFHGAPAWCYSVPNACEIVIGYSGPPATTLLTIPLYGIAS
jgi:hypothetical protein